MTLPLRWWIRGLAWDVFPHLRFFRIKVHLAIGADRSLKPTHLSRARILKIRRSGTAISNMLQKNLYFWASQSWHLLFPSRKPRDWSIRKWDRFHGNTTRGSMASRWEKPLKRGMLPLATAEQWQTGLTGHSETCLMESRFSPRTCKIWGSRRKNSFVLWERMWNNYEGLKVFVNGEPLCRSTWMNTTTTRLWHKTLGWSTMWS